MAAGRPIVASDITVFREVLCEEDNALLFEPENEQKFLNSVERLLTDPPLAEELGHNARQDASAYSYHQRVKALGYK